MGLGGSASWPWVVRLSGYFPYAVDTVGPVGVVDACPRKLPPLGLARGSADLKSFSFNPTISPPSKLSSCTILCYHHRPLDSTALSRITNMAANSKLNLQAVYTAPDAAKIFAHEIPSASSTDSFTAKQSHLTTLQSLVPKLQEEINVFLTERMEEDKKAQGAVSETEAREEENYGEEVVEEDA